MSYRNHELGRTALQTTTLLLLGACLAVVLVGGVAASPADTAVNETANTTDASNETLVDGTPAVVNMVQNSSYDESNVTSSVEPTASHVSVGDEEEFNVIDFRGRTSYYTTNATVAAETDNAVIYVEDGVANNTNINQSDVDRIAAAFEDEIRPQLTSQFGSWDDENGDGRLAILVYDIPGRVAGYHNPRDYTTTANSNNRDMIYMHDGLALDGSDEFNETMTQETQHAVNFNLSGANPNNTPEIWLDEAVANYAEYEVYGTTKPTVRGFYEANPSGTELTSFPGTLSDYGASFMFATYLSEHYGDLNGNTGFMADLIEQPSSGEQAVTDTLADHGYNTTFDEVYRNWTVANYADDDTVADEYGYSTFDPSMSTQSATVSSSPQSVTGTVDSTAVAYVEVTSTTDSFYYRVNDNDLDPVVVEEAGSDAAVSEGVTTSVSSNETVQASNASANITEAARQSALLSVPPVSVNNTFTDATEYDTVTVVVPNTGGRRGYNVTVDEVPSENRFSGTLSANETASYVIPVNRYGNPTLTSVYEHNGDVFASVWSAGSGDVDATLTNQRGARTTGTDAPAGVEATDLVGENPLSQSSVWRLDINGSSGGASYSVATPYLEGGLDSNQVFTLPSDVEVSPNGRNLQAGANNSTQPIQFTVNVSTADRGYTSGPFDEPDASHFNVTVGNESVDDSEITIVSNTQRQYELVVAAPNQSANGQYDLQVSFTDQKFGENATATTTLEDAVSYSGDTASGSASVALVIDRSGSMGRDSPTRISRAQEAANQFLDRFSTTDRVSVVSYASSSRVDAPIQQFGGNESAIRNEIDAISDDGGTNIYAGLADGRDELDAAPNQTSQAVILLSDGRVTSGPGESEVIDLSAALADDGYCVYTVALGSGADEQLMRDVAAQNCGGFRDAGTSGTDIGDIYRDLSATTSGLSSITTRNGSVSATNTTADTFPVDNTTGETVVSVSTNSSASVAPDVQSDATTTADTTDDGVSVLLYYPNGTQVQLNSSTSSGTENPDIVFTSTGDTQTYRINDPRPGNWSYEIANNDSSPVSYRADISGSTGTTLTVISDSSTYVNGSDAELSVILVGADGPVSGASATATVEAPNGSTHQVNLTESSSGQYTRSVTIAQTGQYTATVELATGNITREESVSWTAVNNSSLLDVRGNESATATESGETTLELNLTRPSSPTQSVTPATEGLSEFDGAVLELAALSPEEIRAANVSDEVRQAALQAHNQSESTDTDSVRAATTTGSSSSAVGVYVQTSALTGQNGTIAAANVQPARRSVALNSGDSTELTVTVTVPQGTPEGVYSGHVTLLVQGTQVETPIEVTVTDAGVATYRTRIVNVTDLWQSASPQGQAYYEGQIADSVTNVYFADDASADASLSSGSTAWQGQSLSLESSAGDAGETYQLRAANGSGGSWTVGPVVRNVSLDGTASATVATDGLSGDYLVVDESGTPVRFDNGSADGTGPVDAARFDVREQTLTTAVDTTNVSQGTTTNVTLDSNRSAYTVTVTAGSLTVADLEAAFNQSDAAPDLAGYQLDITGNSATVSINTTELSTGEYTVEFEVVDTAASDSATVNVTASTTPSLASGADQTEVAP